MTNELTLEDLALRVPSVTVRTPDGQAWTLRGDIPADVLLDVLVVSRRGTPAERQAALEAEAATLLAEAEAEAKAAGCGLAGLARLRREHAEDLRAALHEVQAEYAAELADICLGIFRHSYPDMTAERLAALFDARAQERIVNGFFTARQAEPTADGGAATAASSAPPSASPAPAPTTPTPTTSRTTTTTSRTRGATGRRA